MPLPGHSETVPGLFCICPLSPPLSRPAGGACGRAGQAALPPSGLVSASLLDSQVGMLEPACLSQGCPARPRPESSPRVSASPEASPPWTGPSLWARAGLTFSIPSLGLRPLLALAGRALRGPLSPSLPGAVLGASELPHLGLGPGEGPPGPRPSSAGADGVWGFAPAGRAPLGEPTWGGAGARTPAWPRAAPSPGRLSCSPGAAGPRPRGSWPE